MPSDLTIIIRGSIPLGSTKYKNTENIRFGVLFSLLQ